MSPETPPHNAEAERVVIGALLVDPDALPLAAASLRAEDFYLSGLRYAFSAARSLRARGDKLDTVTLRDELIRVGGLDAIGGTAGVASLVDGMPRITNLEDWCRIVSRDARRRRALDALAQARQHVLEDADAGIGSALQALIATASTAGGHAPKTIAERMADLDLAVYQRLDAPGGIIGLRTGLADIDYLLGGLQGGALTIIAAQTSEGKTSLLVTMSEEMARQGHGVALFSLEMTAAQLDLRRLSAELGQSWRDVRAAYRSDPRATKALLAEARESIASRPIYVDDTRPLTVAQMLARCEALRAQHGLLGVVAVDYLQLVKPDGPRDESRVRQLGQIAADLKALAARLHVPVLAASQLNRSLYARKDGAPSVGDLRDSGELAEAADAVILIDRPEQRMGAKCPDDLRGVAHVTVAKNRLGRTGRCRLRFDAQTCTFASLARTENEERR